MGSCYALCEQSQKVLVQCDIINSISGEKKILSGSKSPKNNMNQMGSFDFLLTFPCLTEPFLKLYVKNILYRFLSFSHAATFQVLHFSSLSLLSGIQGSSICRLTVLWS